MQILCISVCILCILYITLFSRTPTLIRVIHLVPFWSYVNSNQWSQIFLNVALFIPFGFFLSPVCRTRSAILIAVAISLAVELLQFLSYRGIVDVDDLISNCIGTGIGLWIYKVPSQYGWKRTISVLMIVALIIGSAITAFSAATDSIKTRVTQQFDFSIISVDEVNKKTVIKGVNSLYDRKTPEYSVFVDGRKATVNVDGKMFVAEVEVPDGKAEVRVKFKGLPQMPTGTWINGTHVEYVAGELPEIEGLPKKAVLKSWCKEYDVLVYQNGLQLLWLIGNPALDRNTEIIYHINTDEPERLPEERIQYKFDNRGFRASKNSVAVNELERIEHYRVFQSAIPNEYNVTAITVGFNTDGKIVWSDSFRVN